jgi:hypothetical protein
MLRWKRTLRTYSSERFVALRDGREVALADLHYLMDGSVSGTIVLDRSAGWTEEQVPDLLAALDEDMLPSVDQAVGNLSYTVIMGETLGSYELDTDAVPAAKPASSGRKRK